jgi:YebC/PmpR family DNA-binding regulatory protein
MSGHSKWASIKHKKGATDAKRGQLFTKVIKEIGIAARLGGGDPVSNPRLRTAILKAKLVNMPKENIDRAIKKGTGELEGVQYVEITYEGYAPGGVALLINVLTDNKNRSAAEIRNLLGKHGGNMGDAGSVAYLFRRKGVIGLDAGKHSEDDVIAVALDAGAEDVTNDGKTIEVSTDPETFEAVLEALGAAKMENTFAEVSMVPEARITLDADTTRKTLRIVELLEDHEDVQSVASNLEIPDDFELPE